MSTKIKIVEPYNDIIVCKGKLVFIPANNLSRDYVRLSDGKEITPIIISETEQIEDGDKYYSEGNIYKMQAENVAYQFIGKKILVLPENFLPEQLRDIINEKLKDGDEVFVECEEYHTPESVEAYIQDLRENRELLVVENRIKLNKDNHITLLPSEHICKYCGAITSQPDEECWNAPNKSDSVVVKENWNDIVKWFGSISGMPEDALPFYYWLKENFNPPTRKNK